MFKLNQIVLILLIGVLGLSVRASADAPTYSVSVGGGSFSPNPMTGNMTATATVTGSLNVQNSNTEIQESGDSWGWTATVTGYKATSQATFGPVPSQITPPVVPTPSQGSATSKITITSSQTTTPRTFPGYYLITVTATDSFNLTDSSTNPATVTPQAPSGSTTLEVVVVVVNVIQYNDPINGWTNAGTLYALKGTSISLRAVPSPSDASFPIGYPIWSGTAGVSGTGATKTVSASTLSASASDSKTINVDCGNVFSKDLVVFDLIPFATYTDTTIPNHNTGHIGVGEIINLSYTLIPSGLSQSQIGSPAWAIDEGGNLLSANQYQAGPTAGGTTFTISITNGASANGSRSFNKLIFAPTLAYQVNFGNRTYHDNDTASVGFVGYYCVSPNDVSFANVQCRETDCIPTTATGSLSSLAGKYHMGKATATTSDWLDLTFDQASYVNTWRMKTAFDQSGFGPYPPDRSKYPSTGYGVGNVSYQIPFNFHVTNGTPDNSALINIVLQSGSVDSSGKATESKGGVSVTAAASDPYAGPFPFFPTTPPTTQLW